MSPTPNLWIGTSWKMNKTLAEAVAFANHLKAAEPVRDPRIQRFVVPPFTMVREVKALLANSSVKVGAQNMHWEEAGAWTGEISPLMLTDCNLDLVELGHSERRKFFGETNETVGLKTKAAISHGLTPLICIGETLEQKEAGHARDILEEQVRGALGKLSYEQKSTTILFAYEPVWAIGDKGVPANSDYANARHAEILAVANEVLGHRPLCLYGGSVNPGNCEDFISCQNIDGLFIGRSAWNAEGYLNILAKCSSVLDAVAS